MPYYEVAPLLWATAKKGNDKGVRLTILEPDATARFPRTIYTCSWRFTRWERPALSLRARLESVLGAYCKRRARCQISPSLIS